MPEDGLVIRDARPDELDRVARLLRDAYSQYRAVLPGDAWSTYRENIMDVRSRAGTSQLIVAEYRGRLAGTVTLYLDGSEEGWPRGWAGIRLLGVRPAYRGKGVGRALMDECVRRCRRSGVRTVGLHTSDMMAVAQRMYERMEFVRVPEFDHRPRPDVLVKAYRLDL